MYDSLDSLKPTLDRDGETYNDLIQMRNDAQRFIAI